MNLTGVNTVCIVGTGLLGGSIGLALRKRGFVGRIVGTGPRNATLERAQAHGCVDEITTDLSAAVSESDLIVLCAPVGRLPDLLNQVASHVSEGAVVTDVGSTKSDIVAASRSLTKAVRFIGSHPMAGKTAQGPEAADPDLFQGKPCIITPDGPPDNDALAAVESLWRCLGMSILTMSAEEHDLKAAVVSHLPHLAAVLLVLTADRLGGREVASTGFESTTRLASSNPPMRLDIITANRRAIGNAIDELTERLSALRVALESPDDDAILNMLERAKAVRDEWESSK